MGVFDRLINIGRAELNSLADEFEDPVKMTEQGIRELKDDLNNGLKELAKVKAMSLRIKLNIETYQELAAEYEQKARKLIHKAQIGELSNTHADKLAAEAIKKKQENLNTAKTEENNLKRSEVEIAGIEISIDSIKTNIKYYEDELITLKSTVINNKNTIDTNSTNYTSIDSSDTIEMLQRMQDKVKQQENLSDMYGNLAGSSNIDKEIDSAIDEKTSAAAKELADLKAKMAKQNKNS